MFVLVAQQDLKNRAGLVSIDHEHLSIKINQLTSFESYLISEHQRIFVLVAQQDLENGAGLV